MVIIEHKSSCISLQYSFKLLKAGLVTSRAGPTTSRGRYQPCSCDSGEGKLLIFTHWLRNRFFFHESAQLSLFISFGLKHNQRKTSREPGHKHHCEIQEKSCTVDQVGSDKQVSRRTICSPKHDKWQNSCRRSGDELFDTKPQNHSLYWRPAVVLCGTQSKWYRGFHPTKWMLTFLTRTLKPKYHSPKDRLP